MITISEALRLHKAGYSVLPVLADGSKSPWYKWKALKQSRLSEGRLYELINSRPCGLAVIGGESSGGLECLDFDRHNPSDPDLFSTFKERAGTLLDGLPIVASPSNGIKVFWRHSPSYAKQSMPLAVGSTGNTLIELLSGKINLVPGGDPAAHSTGKPYKYLQGHLVDCPSISLCRRCELIALAESLSIGVIQKETPKVVFEDDRDDSITTGDYYAFRLWDSMTTWADLLEPMGWEYMGGNTWCRPDKNNAVSGENSANVFTCYSSNANPLDQKSYNRYQLLKTLYFKGNKDLTNNYIYQKTEELRERDVINYVHPVWKLSNRFIERNES